MVAAARAYTLAALPPLQTASGLCLLTQGSVQNKWPHGMIGFRPESLDLNLDRPSQEKVSVRENLVVACLAAALAGLRKQRRKTPLWACPCWHQVSGIWAAHRPT